MATHRRLRSLFSGHGVRDAVVTVGRGILDEAVFEFFEGLRTFDPERAAASLAEDVIFDTPWTGALEGKEAVTEALATFLGDPEKRPSMTIIDIQGNRAIVHLILSVSGRFGRRPQRMRLSCLCLRGRLQQVAAGPAAAS